MRGRWRCVSSSWMYLLFHTTLPGRCLFDTCRVALFFGDTIVCNLFLCLLILYSRYEHTLSQPCIYLPAALEADVGDRRSNFIILWGSVLVIGDPWKLAVEACLFTLWNLVSFDWLLRHSFSTLCTESGNKIFFIIVLLLQNRCCETVFHKCCSNCQSNHLSQTYLSQRHTYRTETFSFISRELSRRGRTIWQQLSVGKSLQPSMKNISV